MIDTVLRAAGCKPTSNPVVDIVDVAPRERSHGYPDSEK